VNAAVVAGGGLRPLGLLLHRLHPELASGRAQLALTVALRRVRMAAEEGGLSGLFR